MNPTFYFALLVVVAGDVSGLEWSSFPFFKNILSNLMELEMSVIGNQRTVTPNIPVLFEKAFARSSGMKNKIPLSSKPDGSSCNHLSYGVEVQCKSYTFCQRTDRTRNPDRTEGVKTSVLCKTNHFGVPIKVSNAEPGKVVVAACLPWEKIDATRKQEILSDPQCSFAAGIPVGDCTSEFKFRNQKGVLTESQQCPDNYIFDSGIRSCIDPCESTGELLTACKRNGKCTSK